MQVEVIIGVKHPGQIDLFGGWFVSHYRDDGRAVIERQLNESNGGMPIVVRPALIRHTQELVVNQMENEPITCGRKPFDDGWRVPDFASHWTQEDIDLLKEMLWQAYQSGYFESQIDIEDQL